MGVGAAALAGAAGRASGKGRRARIARAPPPRELAAREEGAVRAADEHGGALPREHRCAARARHRGGSLVGARWGGGGGGGLLALRGS